MTIRLVQGDVGDVRRVRLGGIEDLSEIDSIRAHVWRPSISGTDTVLDATVVDATERTVDVAFGGADGWLATATPGAWNLEVQVTTGQQVLTWPTGRPLQVEVRGEGG